MREKYISILRKAAEENGGEISYKKYEDQKYSPSALTISTYFGSWTKALQAAGLKTNSKNYTKEEIIQAMLRYAEENDGVLTYDLYREKKYKPSDTTIRKKFGSWNQALLEAGILINREVKKWYTEEEVIRILQNVSEDGKAITVEEYKKQRLQPSLDTVISLFGSWNEAIRKAGLKENRVILTDEEIINAIQDYAKKKGNFTMLDYKEDQKQPSYDAIRNHFGSWANAIRKAGIEPNYVYFTDQEILDEIKRCLDKANTKYLTMEEYQQLSNYPHPMTIYRRFGSWKIAVELAKKCEENP